MRGPADLQTVRVQNRVCLFYYAVTTETSTMPMPHMVLQISRANSETMALQIQVDSCLLVLYCHYVLIIDLTAFVSFVCVLNINIFIVALTKSSQSCYIKAIINNDILGRVRMVPAVFPLLTERSSRSSQRHWIACLFHLSAPPRCVTFCYASRWEM